MRAFKKIIIDGFCWECGKDMTGRTGIIDPITGDIYCLSCWENYLATI